MGRFEAKFAQLKTQGAKAFMPFVTACDPTSEASAQVVLTLEQAGADAVELGFAYSDPIADGPVIQGAYAAVLGAGYKVEDAFNVVRTVRKRSQMPIAGMVSYSIIWKKGPEYFAAEAADAGIDALIIPDLPPEEAAQACEGAAKAGLGIVFLVTPTTRAERLAIIVEASCPFIYYVSVVGTTGARAALPPELAEGVGRVRRMTGKPVVVGFGVGGAEQAGKVAGIADGVIVGSAIVKVVAGLRDKPVEAITQGVREFAEPIARAVKSERGRA